jgi:hypothetical protein
LAIVLTAQTALQDLRTRIDEITYQYPNFSQDTAFVHWFLKTNIVDNEESVLEALKGISHDKGVDALYVDHDANSVYVIQAKYRQTPGLHSESRSDIIALASLGESILSKDTKRFERLVDKSDPKVKESLKNARKCCQEKDYKLVLQFITTGKISNTHKKEAEALINNAWQNATFEFFGYDELIRQMRDYMEGVAPPVPSIQVVVGGEQLFRRFDDKTDISAWVFTMEGRELGKLFTQIGIRIFARNIRGFLGNTEINRGMEHTLKYEPDFFWYFNNGVTIICDDARLIKETRNDILRLANPQIINGQQTTRMLAKHPENVASVIVRVIVVPRYSEDAYGQYKHLVNQIVSATNWQNAISQSDLKSNDMEQVRLERELRKYGYQYLRKRQTKSESRLHVKNQSLMFIRKDELAKYVAACIMEPYELRLGKDRLFEDDAYNKIFDGKNVKDYLLFFWLHKLIFLITRTNRRYGPAKWLALNFLWSEVRGHLSLDETRDKFIHLAERQRNHTTDLKRFNVAAKMVLDAAMTFYRLNRKKDDTIVPENDFFRYKNLSTDFKKFWNSSQNRRKNDFRKYIESFFETIYKLH